MVSSLTTVRRNGKDATLPASNLVPGDIVLLEAGNLVPADLLREEDPVHMLLTAISLAVAAIPEGLPAVIYDCSCLWRQTHGPGRMHWSGNCLPWKPWGL